MILNGLVVFVLSMQFIKSMYNRTWMERYSQPVSTETVTLLWSSTVSIFAIGGLLGTLCVSSMVKALGRYVTSPIQNIFNKYFHN